jgi:thiamine transport system substrate-binding protein
MNLIRVMPAEGLEMPDRRESPLRRFSMEGTMLRTSLVALALSLWIGTAAAQAPTLTIYTYSGFVAKWGPGPKVQKAFEDTCACKVEWVGLEDGVSILNRLRIEGAGARADIALGLDQNLVAEARATGLFGPHAVDLGKLSLPIPWTDPVFVPFDYGHFAVIYDRTRLTNPPTSLAELVNGDPAQKIVIQDPRTSTPGLGLLLWMRAVYGDKAPEAWAKLRTRVLTVTKGWGESYGLFTKGEAPMVLSYTTSPAYHLIEEKKDRFVAASFAEGHYLQVEVAGQLKAARQKELATRFLAFTVSPGFQDVIATGNWMFPVVNTGKSLPPEFDGLVKPAKTLMLPSETVAQNRKAWTDEWLRVMGR